MTDYRAWEKFNVDDALTASELKHQEDDIRQEYERMVSQQKADSEALHQAASQCSEAIKSKVLSFPLRQIL